MRVENNLGAGFQFIKLLFVIRKMCVQNRRGLLFSLLSYFFVIQIKQEAAFSSLVINNIMLKYFYYDLYKTFRKRCFLNGCLCGWLLLSL